ncbi:hypothetical protein Ddc_00787 [Ditylenchus destructor]|nr:hypothetical protein Ddc_00787 [Ditylenchus destructor]
MQSKTKNLKARKAIKLRWNAYQALKSSQYKLAEKQRSDQAGQVFQCTTNPSEYYPGEENMEPRLHRDLLIEFGEQIVQRPVKYIDSTTFKFLFINKIIREASLNKLAKFKVLTIDNGQGRFSERNTEAENNLYLNFKTDPEAHVNLKSLIEIVTAERGKFVTKLCINSLAHINVRKLVDALSLLKDVTFISFPYELRIFTGETGQLLQCLIANNTKTLNCLKHITNADLVPESLRHNLDKVVSTTLRSGTMTEEEDFYAFYGKDLSTADAKTEAKNDGLTMSISVHRNDQVFRAAKWEFIMPNVAKMRLRVVHHFDCASAIRFLNKLKDLNLTLPRLQELDLEMTLMDSDPTLEDDFYDSQECIVPHSSKTVNEIAQRSVEWLKATKLPFKFRLITVLSVDYERKECDKSLLTSAAKETLPYFSAFNMETNVKPGMVEISSTVPIADDRPPYQVRVEFRVLSFSNVSRGDENSDEFVFRPDYCFL